MLDTLKYIQKVCVIAFIALVSACYESPNSAVNEINYEALAIRISEIQGSEVPLAVRLKPLSEMAKEVKEIAFQEMDSASKDSSECAAFRIASRLETLESLVGAMMKTERASDPVVLETVDEEFEKTISKLKSCGHLRTRRESGTD